MRVKWRKRKRVLTEPALGLSFKGYFALLPDTLIDLLDKYSIFLAHLHPLSCHTRAAPTAKHLQNHPMATDRSIPPRPVSSLGPCASALNPHPPRKAPVILLNCASQHQPSTPRLSISLKLHVPSTAHAQHLLPLVHLAVYTSFHVFFRGSLSLSP